MNYPYRIEPISRKILIGYSVEMSLMSPKMHELWPHFIPQIPIIQHKVNSDKLAIKVFPEDYFKQFDAKKTFTQLAAVEVTEIDELPDSLIEFVIEEGLYAIFHYKGLSTDTRIFDYIYNEFIPQSDYELDSRPHFEVLGSLYKNNDPNSEEDIYIPIKLKQVPGYPTL